MSNSIAQMTDFSYEPNKLYELTIAPDDVHQYIGKGDIRDIICLKYFRELMASLNIVYSLRTEITMPQYGQDHHLSRIHFHGFVYWKSYEQIYQFFLYGFSKLTQCSRVQFNYARKGYWLAYMLKSKEYIPESIFRLECIHLKDILILPEATAELAEQQALITKKSTGTSSICKSKDNLFAEVVAGEASR